MISAVLIGAAFPSQADFIGTAAADIVKNTTRQAQLQVVGSCRHGDAVFRVQNVGSGSSSVLTFNLYRDKLSEIVSQRRMRLKSGQMATFKVKEARFVMGDIGLSVNAKSPSFKFQVTTVHCS